MKRIFVCFAAAVLLLSACAPNGGTLPGGEGGIGGVPTGSAASSDPVSFPNTDDLYTTDTTVAWEEDETATAITLLGNTASVQGNGVKVEGSTVTIVAGGTYTVSGTLTDGQLLVRPEQENQTVHLVLCGVNITCSHSSPLYIRKAVAATITLAEGSRNTLTDSANYVFEDATEDEPNAPLFSKCDLTLNGNGSLAVNGNYQNGIVCKDNLVVKGGTYVITAVNDGLRGRDSTAIGGGSFTITAGADGIHANNDTDAALGWIALDGGDFDITAGNDAVQAESTLSVKGISLTAKTGGGSKNASSNSGWGSWGETSSDSAKGLKAGSSVKIESGKITLDTSDDAVHSNGSITLDGGELYIASGDDGVHADEALYINGGQITVTKSYEGLEGTSVTVTGGVIDVTASDDGINSAGGSDTMQPGRPGQNPFGPGAASSSNTFIRITGGTVCVNADGDGIDSNGMIYIDGGTVLVDGPTNGGNSAIDCEGGIYVTGGIVVAAGSAGMAMAPSAAGTTQASFMQNIGTQAGGTLLHIGDADGNTVLAYAPSKTYQNIVVSAPSLTVGETYTISFGGTVAGEASCGLYTEGVYSGGTEYASLTLSSVVTSSGGGGGMGGPGRPGGRW